MWTEREMDDFYDEFEALLLAHTILVRTLIKQGVLDQDQWSGEIRVSTDDDTAVTARESDVTLLYAALNEQPEGAE